MVRTQFQCDYLELHPDCEIYHLLKKNRQHVAYCSWRFQAMMNAQSEGTIARMQRVVHHIFRGQHRRVDNGSNCITLLEPIHDDFCHKDGHQDEARIVCLAAKLRTDGLTLEELDEACGFSFCGWLENIDARPMVESWVFPLWFELQQWIQEMRRK